MRFNRLNTILRICLQHLPGILRRQCAGVFLARAAAAGLRDESAGFVPDIDHTIEPLGSAVILWMWEFRDLKTRRRPATRLAKLSDQIDRMLVATRLRNSRKIDTNHFMERQGKDSLLFHNFTGAAFIMSGGLEFEVIPSLKIA